MLIISQELNELQSLILYILFLHYKSVMIPSHCNVPQRKKIKMTDTLIPPPYIF